MLYRLIIQLKQFLSAVFYWRPWPMPMCARLFFRFLCHFARLRLSCWSVLFAFKFPLVDPWCHWRAWQLHPSAFTSVAVKERLSYAS